ncbi:MAG: protein-glutamate O-methyltransferase CheR [Bacillaceae bacterium]|nr:protein-glutamate O-methyltransferase CheR [Bacillaceae bacterium]
MNKEDLELDLFLQAIYRLSGFDFTKYMVSSIKRRVENRLRLEGLANLSQLTEKVIHEEVYLRKILDDFSINVTEMFRDPSFFQSFRENVVPILRDLPEIRIWHAGCASGEEAYSMAVILHEEGLLNKTKIYATDMNERVLDKARKGIIPISKMQVYTKNYMMAGGMNSFSSYYNTDNQFAYFDESILNEIVFAQHNLVTDGSFNEFHIIICRNVLIYFSLELQNSVIKLFEDSLCSGGFLGLGSKESLRLDIHPDFEEFSCSEKIYRKKN